MRSLLLTGISVLNQFNQYSSNSTTLYKLSEYSQGLEPGGWILFCEMLNALISGQLIPQEKIVDSRQRACEK